MEFIENKSIPGVYEILLSPNCDERGFFMRTYDEDLFKEHGLHRHWVQENHSRSEREGVIRGLHFQLPPCAETKLIRCVSGAVMDVFVDLRKGSSSFGKWGSIELSVGRHNMVFIPRGLAHGFCTMAPGSEILYKVDNAYTPKLEKGLLWSDPDLAITWPTAQPIISAKDAANMTWRELILQHEAINTEESS